MKENKEIDKAVAAVIAKELLGIMIPEITKIIKPAPAPDEFKGAVDAALLLQAKRLAALEDWKDSIQIAIDATLTPPDIEIPEEPAYSLPAPPEPPKPKEKFLNDSNVLHNGVFWAGFLAGGCLCVLVSFLLVALGII